MRITNARTGIINKLLENTSKHWTIRELHEKTGALTYPAVFNFVKTLHKTGHLLKEKGRYKPVNIPGILNILSTQRPLREKPIRRYYHRAKLEERMDLFKNSGLDYAFTAFTGGNLHHQYIMTDKIHVYASPAQFEEQWKPFLDNNGFMPVESGIKQNVYIILSENPFPISLSENVGGFRVAPKATLVSDLLSIGGLGEELALKLMEGFKWTQKPHKSRRKR